MAGTPTVSQETHSGLEELAAKHSRIETFHQDVLRLADTVWHNVRARGTQVEADSASTEEPETPAEDPSTDGDKVKDDGENTQAKKAAASK